MARALSKSEPLTGVLMLTESEGVDAFAALPAVAGEWHIAPTSEATSKIATGRSGDKLIVVSGRQIVSKQGLEVHALGTRAVISDGTPVRDAISSGQDSGALAVMPWGFGKWSGTRGQTLRELVDDGPPNLMFADSGVRPAFITRPAQLTQAEASGRLCLAGTDPLPLGRDEGKVGQYGFLAELALDEDRPFAALKAWLAGLDCSPRTYGRLESTLGFFYAQSVMQIRKRLK